MYPLIPEEVAVHAAEWLCYLLTAFGIVLGYLLTARP